MRVPSKGRLSSFLPAFFFFVCLDARAIDWYTSPAGSTPPATYTLPAGDAEAQARALAVMANWSIVYEPGSMYGMKSHAIDKVRDPNVALQKMLEGLPLKILHPAPRYWGVLRKWEVVVCLGQGYDRECTGASTHIYPESPDSAQWR